MFALLAPLAYDRENLMVAALAALIVAGVVVAVGAWILLFKERRLARRETESLPAALPPLDETTAAARMPEPAANASPDDLDTGERGLR
jgi:hypothetical protein